jgi:hypothetical protein
LVFWTMLKKPKAFPLSMRLAVQGFHFRKVAQKVRVSLTSDIRKLEQAGKHS